MFGTRRLFDLQCNFSELINPFIALPGPQRMDVMNEMSGNSADAKHRISLLMSQTKETAEAARIRHIKTKAAHDALFDTNSVLNTALILSAADAAHKTQELQHTQTQLVTCTDQLSHQRVYHQKSREITLRLSQLGTPSHETFLVLQADLAACTIYARAHQATSAALAAAATYFSSRELQQDQYTPEDIAAAVEVQRIRGVCCAIAQRNNVVYTQEAVHDRLRTIDGLIAGSDLSVQVQEYHRHCARYDAMRAAVGALADTSMTDLLSMQARLDTSLQYTMMWHAHVSLQELQARCTGQSRQQLSETLQQALSDVAVLPVFEQRRKYEALSVQLLQAVISPAEAADRHAQLRQRLDDAERSRSVHTCPHCAGAVKMVAQTLVKHTDAVVVLDDERGMLEQTRCLLRLSVMQYPAVPPGSLEGDITALRALIIHCKDQIAWLIQIEAQKHFAQPLPEGYAYVPNSEYQLANVRHALDLRREYDRLPAVQMPVTPLGFVVAVVDCVELQEQRRQLLTVSFPVTLKSADAIRAHIAYRDAVTRQQTLAVPSDRVTESDVTTYRENLLLYQHLQRDLTEVTQHIASIQWTRAHKSEMEQSVSTLTQQLRDSNHHAAMRTSSELLTVAERELQDATEELSDIQAFKTVYDTASRECVPGVAGRLQRYTNAFLEEIESPMRVALVITDKIKVQCFKSGALMGEITNVSRGERSCVYFAFNVAFALESPLDLLIMDEVTDKLSPVNKDRCLELLLAVTSFPQDVPREQIEQLTNISRAMKTLVSGHNRKTLMFTDHHHHQGGCDDTIDLTHKAQMQ